MREWDIPHTVPRVMHVWVQGGFLVVQIEICFGFKFPESHFLPLDHRDDHAHLEGQLELR